MNWRDFQSESFDQPRPEQHLFHTDEAKYPEYTELNLVLNDHEYPEKYLVDPRILLE